MSIRRGDTALLLIGLAGTGINLSVAIGLLVMTLVALFEGDTGSASVGVWASGSLLAMAAAGIPAIALGLRGLLNREPGRPLRPVAAWILAAFGLLFPVALFAGARLLARPDLSLVAIPIHLATAVLPVLFVVLLVQILGPNLTLRRLWSQFLTGLWGMPIVAIVLEALALIPVGVVAVAGLASSIDLAGLFEPLLEEPPGAGTLTDDTALGLLLNPWVLASLFAFVAGIVPVIEEAVKSLSVLPIARRLSSSEAFVGGALGGAGYALFEALFLTQPDPSWLTTMIGRGGATLMHAFTAAVTCWGISQGVHHRRWGRFALAYLSSITMHATWNGAVLAMGIAQVNHEAGAFQVSPVLESLALNAAPVLLSALSVMALVGLALGARRLSHSDAPAL
jgi:RsiW-degrading membrane proteinase PrsW (M82 family)